MIHDLYFFKLSKTKFGYSFIQRGSDIIMLTLNIQILQILQILKKLAIVIL